MNYTFEKIRGEDRYQVRLKGEFIAYVSTKDPAEVDILLQDLGYNSREEFYQEKVAEHQKMIKG